MSRDARSRRLRTGTITGAMAALILAGAVAPATADGRGHGHDREPVAKNVIILQGDGMAAAHREFFRLALRGYEGELAMDSLRHAGLVHTDPADPLEPVTDSAAGATAFATGVKTFNGAVGVDRDGNPVQTLLERAADAGKATGLVTTAQVTDASPAAFAAHVTDRYEQSAIARQYLDGAQPDVLLGGGEDWWLPAGEPGAWPDNPEIDPEEESQGTEGNLIEEAQELGYEYLATREELQASSGEKLLGLFANEEMFHAAPEDEGAVYEPEVPLPEMAAKALEVVSQDRDGFFLFIEEEGIDEMAHNNNAELTLEAGRDLDETVALVMEFVADHPDTLVLVVGDHATGGLAIENVDDEDESGDGVSAEDGPFTVAGTDLEFVVDWTTEGHTGGPTPITAQGPGAEPLGRIIQNVDLHDIVLRAMLGDVDDDEEEHEHPGKGDRPGKGNGDDRPGKGDRPGEGKGPGKGHGPGKGDRPGEGKGPGKGHGPGKGDRDAEATVIAHRGASGYRPEHTLAAYELAIAQCTDYIEPDVVATKDGELVARHENEISGTTDVEDHPEFADRRTTKVIDGTEVTGWFTEDFTLEELRTLRAEERIPDLRPGNTEYDGQFTVPTFAEVVELARDSETCDGEPVGIAPEIKHPSYFDSIGLSMEEKVVEVLEDHDMAGKRDPVVIQSFETANLRDLEGMTDVVLAQLVNCSGAPYDLVAAGDPRTYADLTTPEGLAEIATYADVLGACKDLMIPRDEDDALGEPTSLIADAHAAGLEVHGWTFRAENSFLPAEFRSSDAPAEIGDLAGEIQAFVEAGMDGLFSDHPDLAVDAVGGSDS